MSEGDDVTSNRVVRQLEDRIRELHRLLGRKTLETEILREALDKPRSKKHLARTVVAEGRFPVKVVAEAPDVTRSKLIDRLNGGTKPRRRYQKAQDAAMAALSTALVAAWPTCGYRRITTILNRQLRSEGLAPVTPSWFEKSEP